MKPRLCLAIIAASVVSMGTAFSHAQERPRADDGNPPTAAARIQVWLDRFDQDKDERISESEATGPMKNNFSRIDSNDDGLIDRAELEALAGRLANPAQRANAPEQRRRQVISTEQLMQRQTDDIIIVPDIAYREGHDRAWKLDLIMPRDRGDQARPGIVFVHGGGWRNGDKRSGTFLSGAIEYAKKGYVCITVNYRLLDEAPFPACIEDVKNAVRWFRAHADEYNVDANRIGGYGNSAGAHLVCMLGLAKKEAGLEGDGTHLDQSSLLQAVCASAAPTDLQRSADARGGRSAIPPELRKKCSPITYVDKNAPPFLLIHGDADTTVNVKHSDTLVEALKAAGAQDVTYLRIEGGTHGVFNQQSAETAPAMEAFFHRTIGSPLKTDQTERRTENGQK